MSRLRLAWLISLAAINGAVYCAAAYHFAPGHPGVILFGGLIGIQMIDAAWRYGSR